MGVPVGNDTISCLLYADDLALIADREDELNAMLKLVYDWCKKWRMKVNINKTKVVHYRIKKST
jgi:hypothetical protein